MAGWKDRITAQERDAVNQAIREAESKTSAEIVPVIARCSGRYDRAEDTIGVWFGIIALGIVWYLTPIPEIELGSWEASHPWTYFVMLAGTVLAGFIAGTVLGNYFLPLRRLFTPHRQIKHLAGLKQVQQRAAP